MTLQCIRTKENGLETTEVHRVKAFINDSRVIVLDLEPGFGDGRGCQITKREIFALPKGMGWKSWKHQTKNGPYEYGSLFVPPAEIERLKEVLALVPDPNP